MNWEVALSKTAATGILHPNLILIIATILLGIGGISLLFGFKTRLGAGLLIIEILMTALIFFPFGNINGPEFQLALLSLFSRHGSNEGNTFEWPRSPEL
ncbi:MAG: DoxX family membrane protein, partial [Parachlamydiaceae bacterium]